MKKALLVLLLAGVGIFPYAVLFGVYKGGGFAPAAAFVFGLVCAIVIFTLSCRGTWTAKGLVLGSMVVKLTQIPAYVMWFVVGTAFFLFGGPVLAFIVDALTILLSGLVGLAGVLRCRAEGRLTTKAAIVNGILQFAFWADVFSAIWVYIKSRKEKEKLS